MDLQKMQKLVIGYKAEMKKISERRDEWNSRTRKLISDTLNLIASEFQKELDWHVNIHNSQSNYEAVDLTFNFSSSGIREQNGSESKRYVKQGAYLCYTQSLAGKVVIYMVPQYVEELEQKPEPVPIKTVEPGDITEDSIVSDVEQFLEEVIAQEHRRL